MRALRAVVLALSVLAGLPMAASAGDAVTLLGIPFPESIAGLAYQSVHDFEKRSPGLGYSVYYRNGPFWADIYVYTLGRNDLPQAYDAAVSRSQYRQAAADVVAAVDQGVYRSSSPQGEIEAAGFLCGRFVIVNLRDEEVDSVLCVTTRGGKFLKIRLSGPRGRVTGELIDRFLAEWQEGL